MRIEGGRVYNENNDGGNDYNTVVEVHLNFPSFITFIISPFPRISPAFFVLPKLSSVWWCSGKQGSTCCSCLFPTLYNDKEFIPENPMCYSY